ncbi:MAG: hypothetical protein HC912_05870 [Saprospiraceae bacterium]|nr:hypothetical protein [Saprospiraceae bacterium]
MRKLILIGLTSVLAEQSELVLPFVEKIHLNSVKMALSQPILINELP